MGGGYNLLMFLNFNFSLGTVLMASNILYFNDYNEFLEHTFVYFANSVSMLHVYEILDQG